MMEYRTYERPTFGSETELFLALLFGDDKDKRPKTIEEESEEEIDDSAAADFYLSYFSYARPSAVHKPIRDEENP